MARFHAAQLIILLVQAYAWVMLLRVILSWIPISPAPALRPAFSFLYDVTEPFLRLFRGLLPPIGGLDLSPMLAFVVVAIVAGALRRYMLPVLLALPA